MTQDHNGQPSPFLSKRTVITIGAAVLLLAIAAIFEFLRFYQPPPLRVASKDFLVKPYVQLGRQTDGSSVEVLWDAIDDGTKKEWQFQLASQATGKPQDVAIESSATFHISSLPKFKRYSVVVPIKPGDQDLTYYVRKNGKVVFQSTLQPVCKSDDSFRVDIAGDIASGAVDEKKVAQAIFRSHPNFLVIPGDIVYHFGRGLEYLARYFPVYNSDKTSLEGVPLLRSTLSVAAPGNHDIDMGAHQLVRNLDEFPDGLAYFYFWKQPLNGPPLHPGDSDTPVLIGSAANKGAFTEAAGDNYPRMTNFSFNTGNAHWIMLDANHYMHWTEKELDDWLEADLAAAKNSTWKFVVYHQPPFSSDTHHYSEQYMRTLNDVFAKYGVDIVFSGHVHNYQRTYPLEFHPQPGPDRLIVSPTGVVDGTLQLDKSFDGKSDTHPKGVIYIVTGCGGATLTGEEIQAQPDKWQPFTARMACQHSFTQCDIQGKKLTLRQILADGKEIDRIDIDKD